MEKIRFNAIGMGVVAFLISILFFSLAVFFSMNPAKFLVDSKSYFTWVIFILFSLIALDVSFVQITGGIKMRESNLEYKDKSIWAKIAFANQYLNIASFFVGLAVIFTLFYFSSKALLKQVVFSFNIYFLILILICVIYSVVRILIRNVISRLSKKTIPSYTLEKDGIIINLNMKNLTDLSKKYIVKIGFKEIDEIKVLSMVEAQAFMKYKVGPDVDLVIKQTKDLYNYTKGKISRPRVYAVVPDVIGKKSIFIQGKDLFYLISVANEDISDLVKAFNDFKKKKSK